MKYFRIILGKQHKFFDDCLTNGYVGVDFGMDIDFSNDLPENWKDFNKKYIPEFMRRFPEASKIRAGLACGTIHTLSKALQQGDLILSPDGLGNYHLGEISSDYIYEENSAEEFLRHRRKVTWQQKKLRERR